MKDYNYEMTSLERYVNGYNAPSTASPRIINNIPTENIIATSNSVPDSYIPKSQVGWIDPYAHDAKLRSESKEASNLLLLAYRWTSLKSSILQDSGYSKDEIEAIENEAKNNGEAVNLSKYLSPEKLSLLVGKLNQEYGLKLSAQDIALFDKDPNYLENLKTKAQETIYNNANVLSEITELRLDSLQNWLTIAIGSSDTNLSSGPA
jgi:hypothetical protein